MTWGTGLGRPKPGHFRPRFMSTGTLGAEIPQERRRPNDEKALGEPQADPPGVVQFLDANNLERPQSSLEWRQCYRELGKFLAMKAFLTNTPQVVLEIPVATITDTREHMIMRAICDERISLPMDAFKEYPEVYEKIAEVIPVGDMMDVKVALVQHFLVYWHCEVPSSIYHKLGYSAAAITAMGLNPYGGPITLTAQGATPGSSSGGTHSKDSYCSVEADDGKTYEEARKPPITVHNVVSALGKDYMKKNYPGQGRHAFWGQMEAWCLAVSARGRWSSGRKVWPVGVTFASGAGVSGGARWAVPGSSRLHRAGRSCSWSWMSLQSVSTTAGWKTASSSTSGWSQLPLFEMALWRWTQILSTASASVFPMAWGMWVMRSGLWSWQILRRLAWKGSTILRTSTSRDDIPLLVLPDVLHFQPRAQLHDWCFCSWGTLDVSLQPPVCGNPRAGTAESSGDRPVSVWSNRSSSLEPKWRHFAQVYIADIFLLSSKLPSEKKHIYMWSRVNKVHEAPTCSGSRTTGACYPFQNPQTTTPEVYHRNPTKNRKISRTLV